METRDHGGNLDTAMARFGGMRADWLDLSTGINPVPFPVPRLPVTAWTALPTRADTAALETAARTAYGTSADCVALAGAQAAIQLIPRLRAPGRARVLGPTYNEHAGALGAHGWAVETVTVPEALAGADLAVVVNPNNPDGGRMPTTALGALAAAVGLLVVDESFADATPEMSLAPHLPMRGTIVLRSFGKFYGLAGLRLGFALGGAAEIATLRALAGPWAVGGPAIATGRAALADRVWQADTAVRLEADAARLDTLSERAGMRLVGGTCLFRTYAVHDAAGLQRDLARQRIWTRVFPYSERWIRVGLPGDAAGWERLAAALA
jgi:cobalamin biosynthetic protein CobC